MAHEVNVNDGLIVTESPAVYGVGGGDSIIENTLLYEADILTDSNHVPYFINAFLGATTGYKTLMDAPGSGSYIIVKKLTVICADKNTVRIGSGESGGWVEKILLGPLIFNTETSGVGYKIGAQYIFEPFKPYRLPVNKALTADVDAAGLVLITAEVIVN